MRDTGSAVVWTTGYLAIVALPLLVLLVPPTPPGLGVWWDLSMALGFAGLAVLGAQFGLTARFRRASAPFGIDILYFFHRWVAIGGLGLVLAHYGVLRATAPEALGPLLPPDASWHMTAGRLALILMTALVVTSVWRKPLRLEYDRWRIWHAAMAVAAVLFAVWHVAGTAYYTGGPVKRAIWIAYMAAWVALVLFVRVVKPWTLLRRPYRVSGVRGEPGNSWTITVEPVGHAGIRFRPGQFAWLTLGRSPFAAKEHPFSIASSAAPGRPLEFTIKELGDFTRTVGRTPVGTTAYVDGPFGVFTPDRHPDAAGFLLVAGGVGIAPMMSMLRTFADRGERRPISLVQACEGLDEALFREEIQALREILHLRVSLVVRQPEPGWTGEVGLITRDVLRRALPDDPTRWTCFLCGPQPMTDAVERELRWFGVLLRRIHVELFDMV